MSKIELSIANPIHFKPIRSNIPLQYTSVFFRDGLFNETIRDFQQEDFFVQPWLLNDPIKLQIKSNFNPIALEIQSEGKFVFSQVFKTMQEDFFSPGTFILQSEIDLSILGIGFYKFYIKNSTNILFESEKVGVFENLRYSNYIEFSNSVSKENMYFKNYSPSIRVPSMLEFDRPGSIDTIFKDDEFNGKILNSVNYNIYKLYIASETGCPAYFIDKLSRILSMDSIKIDGRFFVKPEGVEFEKVEVENKALKGWAIELHEQLNKDSIKIEDGQTVLGTSNVSLVIETKGFGIDDDGGNFTEIHKVQ